MNRITHIDPNPVPLQVRLQAPAPLDAEPCAACGGNPSQYHTAGPGYPVFRGPCRKCQEAVDAEIRRDENRTYDERMRKTIAAIQGINDPEKRLRMQRNPALRLRASECFTGAHRICPDRSRPHIYCDHCHVTDAGRRLYGAKESRSAA